MTTARRPRARGAAGHIFLVALAKPVNFCVIWGTKVSSAVRY